MTDSTDAGFAYSVTVVANNVCVARSSFQFLLLLLGNWYGESALFQLPLLNSAKSAPEQGNRKSSSVEENTITQID